MQIGDGVNDGQFKIKSGQGLSQAICEELGIDPKSVKLSAKDWQSVFNIVNEQQKETKNVYRKGDNLFGKASENYVVYEGDKINISKNRWGLIADIFKRAGMTIRDNGDVDEDPVKETVPKTGGQDDSAKKTIVEGEQAPDSTEDVVTKPATEDVTNPNSNDAANLAKKLSTKLKPTLTHTAITYSPEEREEIRGLLNQIDKDNILVVLKKIPNIVTAIDEDFGFGGGLGVKDVFDNIITPLVKLADELGVTLKYPDGRDYITQSLGMWKLTPMKDIKAFVNENFSILNEAQAKAQAQQS